MNQGSGPGRGLSKVLAGQAQGLEFLYEISQIWWHPLGWEDGDRWVSGTLPSQPCLPLRDPVSKAKWMGPEEYSLRVASTCMFTHMHVNLHTYRRTPPTHTQNQENCPSCRAWCQDGKEMKLSQPSLWHHLWQNMEAPMGKLHLPKFGDQRHEVTFWAELMKLIYKECKQMTICWVNGRLSEMGRPNQPTIKVGDLGTIREKQVQRANVL